MTIGKKVVLALESYVPKDFGCCGGGVVVLDMKDTTPREEE